MPMAFDPRTKLEGDYQGIDRLQLRKDKKEGEMEKLTVRLKLLAADREWPLRFRKFIRRVSTVSAIVLYL
jgi:hypothetical protein